MLKVRLASCSTYDKGCDPSSTVYGAKDMFVLCETIAEAEALCTQFIERHDLKVNNWIGGQVIQIKGSYIGKITYSGSFIAVNVDSHVMA